VTSVPAAAPVCYREFLQSSHCFTGGDSLARAAAVLDRGGESSRDCWQLPRLIRAAHPCKRTGADQAVFVPYGYRRAPDGALDDISDWNRRAIGWPTLRALSSSCHTTVLWLQQYGGTSLPVRRRHFQTANTRHPRPACNCRPDLRRLRLYTDRPKPRPCSASLKPCSASPKKQLRGTSGRRNRGSA
jgi:hypothetical protein